MTGSKSLADGLYLLQGTIKKFVLIFTHNGLEKATKNVYPRNVFPAVLAGSHATQHKGDYVSLVLVQNAI